jgi:hypothetical protein
MRRVRTKSLPEFCIRLTPSSYARIMAIATEAQRDPADLIASAIAIFAAAIRDVKMLHPPKRTPWPEPKRKPYTVAPIGATVQRVTRDLTKGKPT